jgi:hypothetical protein
MFTAEEREHVRAAVTRFAEADPAVLAAARTGSYAVGESDSHSDVDIALAVAGDLGVVMDAWTRWFEDVLGALHHWDLASGSAVFRVFLLPGGLEADVAFVPVDDFGPHGPQFRLVFGEAHTQRPPATADRTQLVGLAWHHVLHVRACIARGRLWQAEHWTATLRDKIVALACLRLGIRTDNAKGAHLLPDEATRLLAATLVRELTAEELARALSASVAALLAELECLDGLDADLAMKLRPVLTEAARIG